MDAHDDPLIDLAVLGRIAAWFGISAPAAYAGGLIDIDRLALALRRDRATVEGLVAELGLVPAEPEPDWWP